MVVGSAMLCGAFGAAADSGVVYDFQIESQALADALEVFSFQSDLDVLAPSEALEGRESPRLLGSYTVEDALDRLIGGSGLAYCFTSDVTVAITEENHSNGILPIAEYGRGLLLDFSAEGPFVELAPYTVSATGSRSVLYVTRADLEQRQASDLEDTLSIDPSITVGGSTGVAQKIYVRNLGEGLLNVSIDGAQQSGSLFHHIGRLAIEPELLKQVEVQSGIGNATDGPGALGGAIRFETIGPEDLLRGTRDVAGVIKFGAYGNTEGHKLSATGAKRLTEHWSSMISWVNSEHDEIRDGEGNRIAGSGTEQSVVLAKVSGALRNGQELRINFEQLEETGNKLRRPEWEPSPSNPVFPMSSSRQTAVIGYSIRPQTSDWLNFDLKLSRTFGELMQDAVWGPYFGSIESYQLNARNTQYLRGHEIVYGLDFREDTVVAGPDETPASVKEKGSVIGVLIQDQYQPSEALKLNYGIRFDSYRLHDSQNQKFLNSGLSPNFGFDYRITPEIAVKGRASASYRGPDINDAFRIDIATNDPELKGETARNYEVSLDYGRGAFDLNFGLFAHRIENVITNTLPWGHFYTNAGELRTDGIFTRASYALEMFRFSLQYNNADTTIDGRVATRYQYGSLVSTTGDTWVAEAAWTPFEGFGLGWNLRLVEGIDGIPIPSEVTGWEGARIDKPGYATHDVFLGWSPQRLENLSVNLTVKNLFDKYYRSHGSIEDLTELPGFEAVVGAPEPGRDVRLSVTVRY